MQNEGVFVSNKQSYYGEYRTFACVDLGSIRHNGQVIKRQFPDQKILSVMKADAYGHGISGILPAYETFSDWYAVATVEEALTIRQGSDKPVLIFGPVPEEKMVIAARRNLTFTVGNTTYANVLDNKMQQAGLCANCHLKIDTGLNRAGVRWRDNAIAMDAIIEIHNHKNLCFTGTYTHLACAEGQLDWEVDFTKLQMERYLDAIASMEKAGIPVGIRHCCSTGGSLVNPQYRLDMVRLGMMPMGMSYSDESVKELGLIPAMTWVSYVAQIEELAAGEPVSYGCTFRAEKPMKVGIVTCGYADGYRRVYSNKTSVLVGGKKVRVLGRVAMDYMMIDLTDVPNAETGMEVILLGTDGVNTVTALELSQFGESVSGEVTCVISQRVLRIYTNKE